MNAVSHLLHTTLHCSPSLTFPLLQLNPYYCHLIKPLKQLYFYRNYYLNGFRFNTELQSNIRQIRGIYHSFQNDFYSLQLGIAFDNKSSAYLLFASNRLIGSNTHTNDH